MSSFGFKHYVGRFAPSPTGCLHFGSLVAALASYLDARAVGGTWLVRMEDLDPPRAQVGAAQSILQALQAHGLFWDAEVVFQSERHNLYQLQLQSLIDQGRVYPCACSRQRLSSLAGGYDGYCLKNPPDPETAVAYKFVVGDTELSFEDLIQGPQQDRLRSPNDDFVLKRKDGLYAYQLAVVVDDWLQGVTHVVRGSDLLSSTGRQASLFGAFNVPPPQFAHVPVAENNLGQKLSKQNHAPELDNRYPVKNLFAALSFLGQSPDPSLLKFSIDELLRWAIANWQIEQVPKRLGVAYNG